MSVYRQRHWLAASALMFCAFAAHRSLAREPASTSEFVFESGAARRMMARARVRHGLIVPPVVSLAGTMIRGEVRHDLTVALDAAGHYKRSSGLIEGGEGDRRVTGVVTHVLGTRGYFQWPTVPAAIIQVAHPRIEREYVRTCVTTLLRPPVGRPMRVRVGTTQSFASFRVQALEVRDATGVVCNLMLRADDATVVGWTLMAETSEGDMRQTVVVDRSRGVGKVLLPVVQRERTGEKYGSLTSFTSVTLGDAARRKLLMPLPNAPQ